MPKFIVKPKSTSADPHKRQKVESMAVQDNGKGLDDEQKSESAKQTNVLQSLCQNYDSDDSEWGHPLLKPWQSWLPMLYQSSLYQRIIDM